MSIEAAETRNAIMERYGYDMWKNGTDYNEITAQLFNPNYSIKDFIDLYKNIIKSLEPYMDFFTCEIPKLSLLGRYDYKVLYYNINGEYGLSDKLLACLRIF